MHINRSELAREAARLDEEIAALEAKRRELDRALGEFLHEARRVRDALERVGGRSFELEAKAKTLARNRRLTERDLKETAAALEALAARRAEIGAKLKGGNTD